jgi:hypothetical protein
MNKVVKNIMTEAMESTGVEGMAGAYYEINQEKFLLLVIEQVVSILNKYSKANEESDSWVFMLETIKKDIKETLEAA